MDRKFRGARRESGRATHFRAASGLSPSPESREAPPAATGARRRASQSKSRDTRRATGRAAAGRRCRREDAGEHEVRALAEGAVRSDPRSRSVRFGSGAGCGRRCAARADHDSDTISPLEPFFGITGKSSRSGTRRFGAKGLEPAAAGPDRIRSAVCALQPKRNVL
jgi:hypothetical protein